LTDLLGALYQILFKGPHEELIQVKGTTGVVNGELVITSLTFITNHRVVGPFGRVRETEFRSSPNGKVVGFYGRAGICLSQIGFISEFSSESCAEEVIAQGPWGSPDGNAFYHGIGELSVITIGHNSSQVISLQMTYDHNGTEYVGDIYGGLGGELTTVPKSSSLMLSCFCSFH